MRLSRIWKILQIKKGVIHRGRRPRWITSSEIRTILHILRKPNSTIALLFIQNISPFLQVKEFRYFAFVFLLTGQRFNNLQRAALSTSFDVISSMIFSGLHFWRHWFNMTKILSKFSQQQLFMVYYACGFNQSETGKYFERIITFIIKNWIIG